MHVRYNSAVSKKAATAVGTGLVLFFSAGMVALFVLFKLHALNWPLFVLIMSMPAFASLVIAALSGAMPGLAPTPKSVFPWNITLPLAHCALIVVVSRLALTTPSVLERVPDRLRPIGIWGNPLVLGSCLVLEVVLISAFGALGWLA